MNILLDVYSDYGSIVSASSTSGNMVAKNVLSQVPLIWKTVSGTSHTIAGSLAFVDDYTYVCPVDSYYIDIEYAPIGTQFTLGIHTDLGAAPTHTYTVVNTKISEVLYLVAGDYVTGFFWKLTITPPSASMVKISRVMVGQAWLPNLGPSGDITIAKNAFIKNERQRNGGTFISPSVNFRTVTLQYRELEKTVIFSLLDALSRYGSGTTIFVEGSNVYGRLIRWSEPTKSVSGNYTITLTIEETL